MGERRVKTSSDNNERQCSAAAGAGAACGVGTADTLLACLLRWLQVTFHLSRDMFLTVEARDLDTARHKRW